MTKVVALVLLHRNTAELSGDRLLGHSPRGDAEFGAVEHVEKDHGSDNREEEDEQKIAADAVELADLEIDIVEQRRIRLRHAVGLVNNDLVNQDEGTDGCEQRGERTGNGDELETTDINQIADQT